MKLDPRWTTRAALLAVLLATLSAESWSAPRRALLKGTVTGASGEALGKVQVKLFADGLLQASALSDSTGAYILEFPYDESAGTTLAAWWVPAASDLVAEVALLRESEHSRELGLWSPCLPRLEVRGETTYDVVLHPRSEKLRLLAESDCVRAAE